MKLLAGRFTTPKSPAPLLSVRVTVNVCAAPAFAAPRSGLRLTTAMVPEGVKGTPHVPMACHPELPAAVSRAAV